MEKATDLKTTLKALLGFSRALVTIFVVAQAGLAAIIALNDIPSTTQIILGILACSFGSMALIAYNDYLDVEIDKIKISHEKKSDAFDIGSFLIQHPIARGVISKRTGAIWIICLSVLSMVFTYLLDPLLPLILPIIAIFVTLYCKLSTVTPLKTLAVSVAVTLGGVAGWLAVTNEIRTVFWVFVAWTFLWEIGGRNIPNDFGDLEEDRKVGIKTIPVVLGPKNAARIIAALIVPTVGISFFLGLLGGFPPAITGLILALGVNLLIIPSMKLMKDPTIEKSRELYNSSAIYPGLVLLILTGSILYEKYLIP